MTSHQAVYEQYQSLPKSEQSKLRSLLNEENRSHDEVFGFLRSKEFSVHEAIEYLDMSEATFRRKVQEGLITASSTIGRSHLYSLSALKALKKSLKK